MVYISYPCSHLSIMQITSGIIQYEISWCTGLALDLNKNIFSLLQITHNTLDLT